MSVPIISNIQIPTLGVIFDRHRGDGGGGHTNGVEHSLINVVSNHEGGIDFAGRAARHSYVGERNGSK